MKKYITVFFIIFYSSFVFSKTKEECISSPVIKNVQFSGVWGKERYINFEGCQYEGFGILVCSSDGFTCAADWKPLDVFNNSQSEAVMTNSESESGSTTDNTPDNQNNSPQSEKQPAVDINSYNPDTSSQSDYQDPEERGCNKDQTFPLTSEYTTGYDESGKPIIKVEQNEYLNTFDFIGNNYMQKYNCLYVKTSSGYVPNTSRYVNDAFTSGKLRDCTYKSGFTPVHKCKYQGERPVTENTSSTGGSDHDSSSANHSSGGSSTDTPSGHVPNNNSNSSGSGSNTGSGNSSGSDGNGFDYEKMADLTKDRLTSDYDLDKQQSELNSAVDKSVNDLIASNDERINSIQSVINGSGVATPEFSGVQSQLDILTDTSDNSLLFGFFNFNNLFPAFPKAKSCESLTFGSGKFYEFNIDCKYVNIFKKLFAFILYVYTFYYFINSLSGLLRHKEA